MMLRTGDVCVSATELILGKYPVLLWPGLMQSSGTYCVNDESSLAFFLCKAGYDVWLGNNRGYFHPKHKHLKPSNYKFWSWNLTQMGYLDIPATISHVCHQTNRNKVLPRRILADSDCTRCPFSRHHAHFLYIIPKSTSVPGQISLLFCRISTRGVCGFSPRPLSILVHKVIDLTNVSRLHRHQSVYTTDDVHPRHLSQKAVRLAGISRIQLFIRLDRLKMGSTSSQPSLSVCSRVRQCRMYEVVAWTRCVVIVQSLM